MTAGRQADDSNVAAAELMSPDAVAAMERRLLDAFVAHHAQPHRSLRRTGVWVAAGAACVLGGVGRARGRARGAVRPPQPVPVSAASVDGAPPARQAATAHPEAGEVA